MITESIELVVVEAGPPNGPGARLQTEWSWDDKDPFAVNLRFAEDHVWTFAADILTAGVQDSAGLADVKMWRSGKKHVRLRLESHDGVAVFEIERKPLKDFSLKIAIPAQREIADKDIEAWLRGVR